MDKAYLVVDEIKTNTIKVMKTSDFNFRIFSVDRDDGRLLFHCFLRQEIGEYFDMIAPATLMPSTAALVMPPA